jgi:hypothetical protein
MARACTVCVHPQRDAINRELMQPGASPTHVAVKYQLVPQSVTRHCKNHLTFSSQAAAERQNALTIIKYATELYERASTILAAAERVLASAEGDAQAAPRSIQAAAATLREVRASIELLSKLVTTEEDERADEGNALLDARIAAALDALAMPELGAGPALASGVEEAEVIPD